MQSSIAKKNSLMWKRFSFHGTYLHYRITLISPEWVVINNGDIIVCVSYVCTCIHTCVRRNFVVVHSPSSDEISPVVHKCQWQLHLVPGEVAGEKAKPMWIWLSGSNDCCGVAAAPATNQVIVGTASSTAGATTIPNFIVPMVRLGDNVTRGRRSGGELLLWKWSRGIVVPGNVQRHAKHVGEVFSGNATETLDTLKK